MHPDLHRYLDGEIPREALPPELAIEAEEWEVLLEAAAHRLDGVVAPAWLESRIMGALPESQAPRLWRRLWDWFVEPKQIRLRPLPLVSAGAAAALLLVLRPDRTPMGLELEAPVAATTHAAQGTDGTLVYVQFVFAGSGVREVAVAGDFNGWDTGRHVLRDPDGDGVWTGLIALPPGIHKYMFVVDGERWVTDPRAERYVDDGFGMRNALIAVAPPVGRST